jgi:bifunctional non-homologous end joining protein LigD
MSKVAKSPKAKLARYRQMRDFERTPEPRGRVERRKNERLRFVVQKHDATRLHYDFRLEHAGVLKSWAVPKEPSLDPKDRRLAVQTEDHPLEYGGFEGEIPEGEYGAGSVVIWDRGHWTPLKDPERGLADGKLDFELHGERLTGRFTLVRMAKRSERERTVNWLLIKRHESSAGRTNRGRRSVRNAPRRAVAADALPGAVKSALPRQFAPQLATAVTRAPDDDGWIFEPKLDGYRLLCRIEGGDATLLTRRGLDWTERFAAIAAAARELPCRAALLDGEAVVFDSRGVTSFQRLQNALTAGSAAPIVLVAFDLTHLDGSDLTRVPLTERKRALERLLAGAPPAIRYGAHVTEGGAAFFAEACRLGLEGIVAKRADAPYRQERTKTWLKVKCLQRQEFVVVGYTDPGGSRSGFGALLVATRASATAPLRYAGKVGTGFDERLLKSLHARLAALERRTAPVESTKHVQKHGVHWVEPKLVAEIAFTEWTDDERLRHPIFYGLREDKVASDVVEERAVPTPSPRKTTSGGAARTASAAPRPRVRLTNPDKVLFPEPGITKRQLADYWQAVAAAALPLVARRALTLFRCPDGYGAHCFYQKHVGAAVPDYVPRVIIEQDKEPYTYVEDVTSLLGLVQVGVLELHVWGSRVEHLDQPDVLVFDLDPAEDVPWREVATAAFDVKDRLEALGLVAFAKLTGGKGVHVVVPVQPGPTWPAVKRFARTLVNEMVRAEPRRFVASMSKTKRVGKIFIDYLRNDRESTAIGAYSPRARAGAPVALPIEWAELDADGRQAPRFGVLEVPRLIRTRKRDPWEGFEAARRSLL